MPVSAIAVVVGLNVILGATPALAGQQVYVYSVTMAKSARAPIRSTTARMGCG
jgi:hypothetical protein